MKHISSNLRIAVRPAEKRDQQRLAALMHFESHVHRHLDWISPIDMIGNEPFFVVEQEGQVHAALACPVDPPGVAWLRLFLASGSVSHEAMWQLLWSEARQILKDQDISVVGIAMHQWMSSMLALSQFQASQNVVFLSWQPKECFEKLPEPSSKIRTMKRDDLPSIHAVDEAAFGSIWRNSLAGLTAAFDQSYLATVVETQGTVVGYQISTMGHLGGHLARLAVHPSWQGRKIGYDLLVDVLRKFMDIKIRKVSVNTQEDNHISLKLYEKVGFERSGEVYGVYKYKIE